MGRARWMRHDSGWDVGGRGGGSVYRIALAPVVSSVSPVAGPTAGGTVVTVNGSNLSEASSVKFGGVAGTGLTPVSASQLKVTAPAHAAGVVDVRVTTSGGTSGGRGGGSVYVSRGACGVVGVAGGGPGCGWHGRDGEWFGSVGSDVGEVRWGCGHGVDTGVGLAAEGHCARAWGGHGGCAVTTPGGTSAVVAADRYTYRAAPVVSSVSPVAGPTAGGTTITITGSSLANTTAVFFGSTSASFSVASATSITATAPPGTGVVDVTVQTPYGTSSINASARYSFEPPPTTCGTLTRNETWTNNESHILTCDVTIPAGVTLTLAAGTVIKANPGLHVNVYGSLVADGTAADPVVFTSYADDSVGGDTNADGSVSSPAAGDWSGIYAQGGSLSLDHAKVAYAVWPVQASSAAVSVTNSTITEATGGGILVSDVSSVPTILGNTVSDVRGQAIIINNSSVDLTRLNSNSGSGTGGNGVFLSGDTQTVDATLPWSGTCCRCCRVAAPRSWFRPV